LTAFCPNAMDGSSPSYENQEDQYNKVRSKPR